MQLPKDTTYEKAAELLDERKPDPRLLLEVQENAFGLDKGKKLVADLFVKARQLVAGRPKERKVNAAAREAVDAYLTAIERFESGTLDQHAAGKSIADLL